MLPTKEQLDAHFKEFTKYEDRFCEEMGYCKNEYGVYIFTSPDFICSINLSLTLTTYKKWLIDHSILKEIDQ